MPAVESHPPLVYFAESLKTGLVKIGYTTQLNHRMQYLSVDGRRINLLGVTDGGRAREKEIHADLDRFLVKSEWFLPSPLLLEYVAVNCEDRKGYQPSIELADVPGSIVVGGVTHHTLRDAMIATGKGSNPQLLRLLIYRLRIPTYCLGRMVMMDHQSYKRLLSAVEDWDNRPRSPRVKDGKAHDPRSSVRNVREVTPLCHSSVRNKD
jgi:hypothetical protein